MSDLVSRLRALAAHEHDDHTVALEAIDALDAERERLAEVRAERDTAVVNHGEANMRILDAVARAETAEARCAELTAKCKEQWDYAETFKARASAVRAERDKAKRLYGEKQTEAMTLSKQLAEARIESRCHFDAFENAEAETVEVAAERDRLREALRPFAAEWPRRLTMADWDAARAALAGEEVPK